MNLRGKRLSSFGTSRRTRTWSPMLMIQCLLDRTILKRTLTFAIELFFTLINCYFIFEMLLTAYNFPIISLHIFYLLEFCFWFLLIYITNLAINSGCNLGYKITFCWTFKIFCKKKRKNHLLQAYFNLKCAIVCPISFRALRGFDRYIYIWFLIDLSFLFLTYLYGKMKFC